MPDEVILDVTTIEENVTVETTAGDVVEIQVVAPTGPTGATGPAGPNSVTSATTSDGTANLSLGDLEVVGGEIYTDGDYSNIYTQGDGAEIFTIGTDAIIYTQGADAHISTSGDSATIYTSGASGSIYTTGANAGISTVGTNATMGTLGTNATISTAGSAAHIQTNHASAAVKSTNFAAVESGGASLVDGSMQPCLTWSAGGRNLTIPSGTAVTFDSTSYTYGTGAAAAHRTALGLTTLATTTPGTNVANFLEFPTSANLASALTDENGTGGGFVRAEGATLTSPSLVGPVNLTSQDASTADRVMTRDLSDTRYGQKIYSTISTTSSTVLASYDTLFTKVLPVGYYRFEYRVWMKNNEASASISPRLNFTASSGTISVDGVRESRYNQGTYLASCFRNAASGNHDGGNLTVGSPNFTEGSMAFFGFINVTAQATMLFRFSHNTSAPTNPTTVEGHLVLEYLTAS